MENTPSFVVKYANVLTPRLGAKVVHATDDFFAPKERLIDPSDPQFIPGKYDDHGKWMDGWETRRRREPGFDHCIIKLGGAVSLAGVDISTKHFTGNSPLAASLDSCHTPGIDFPKEEDWTGLIPQSPLEPNSSNYFEILEYHEPATHVRLNIFPDGGIARLRLHGIFTPEPDLDSASGAHDLACLLNGARAVACNNEHFGSMHNITMPPPAINMGDGWETRRRRTPGHDWAIIQLSRPSKVERLVVDTSFFKGNFPDRCSVQAAFLQQEDTNVIVNESQFWPTILAEQKLQMDSAHSFSREIESHPIVTHIRLNIFPDGGISRIHVYGK